MKRILWLVLAQMAAGALWAQEALVSTRVFTQVRGAQFTVDGTLYTNSAVFLWPEKSKHILSIDPVQNISSGIRFSFTNWKDSQGRALSDGTTLAVTADRTIAYYQAMGKTEYAIGLQFNSGGLPSFSCTPGTGFGKVYLDGACYAQDAQVWADAGTTHTAEAYPPPGYVCLGWDIDVGNTAATVINFVLNKPIPLHPRFQPAVRVTLETSPPGLQVLADRAPVNTPVTLDWAQNSQHTLGPVSPQWDPQQGHLWVFDSWAHGGSEQQAYTATGPVNIPVTLTARFVPGAQVSLLTSPEGLKLAVDGREIWPSYNFVWAVGSTHQVSAPAEQVNARGRRYLFQNWSNGGAPSQDVTVREAAAVSGLRLVASYEMLGKLTIRSSPTEVGVLVNGAECRTPCLLEPRQGASVRVAAPATVAWTDAMRLDFDGWADGGPQERSWTAGAEEAFLVARYRLSHLLRASVDPPEAAAFQFYPPSADGYYPAETEVTVVLEPKTGYRLKYWEGDLLGRELSGLVRMSGPRLVRAVLEKVPSITPVGVRNAAGETPQPGVAAGSIIALYGANLAPAFESGPASPLAQTIAGVTVRVSERLLPLVFVSPEQINAQLPSDLREGDYTATVRWEGQPEVKASFQVVRNAPGLFSNLVEGQPFALGTRPDGSLLSADNPARRGETVTLLGTGFGPYQGPVLDGFAVPETVKLPLADKVEVLLGDRLIDPSFAGAAPGYVGLTALRFALPADLPTGALELKTRVNARTSNTVLLAVK